MLDVARISIGHHDGTLDSSLLVRDRPVGYVGGAGAAEQVEGRSLMRMAAVPEGQPLGVFRAAGGIAIAKLTEGGALGTANFPLLDADHAARIIVSKVLDPSLLGIGIRDGDSVRLLASALR